ncbi:MAG: prepilin-type N-terminal cleavage/methylation domain-containing protein [Nitrospiria bacterium]
MTRREGRVTSRRLPAGPRGFTLLEIVIVVFILGLVALVVAPRLHRFTGGDARSAARELAGLVDGLVQEAVASHTIYRLNYDVDAEVFWVTALTQTGGVLEEGPPRPKRALPADVRFADVMTPHQGVVTQGKAFTQFFPSGRVTRTTIHLKENERNDSTLMINPITGRVTVLDGYQEGRSL